MGEQVDRGYDSAKDLYYKDYKYQRCGRSFRNYYGYGEVVYGQEFELGTACIIDQRDKDDLKKYSNK